jgi:small subunit ribosomal protein S1
VSHEAEHEASTNGAPAAAADAPDAEVHAEAGDMSATDSEESGAEGEPSNAAPGQEGAAAGAAAGEKKRRRRRRRKKPGAHAEGGDAGGEHTEPAGGSTPPEGTHEAGGEEHAIDHESSPPSAQGRGPRDKKKERKHGPPRERPPVNVGDIVFGKILEITDEAIFIDIPGKAHAIFDRGEMVLPDDDDTATSSGARSPASHAPAAAEVAGPAEESASEGPAELTNGAAEAATAAATEGSPEAHAEASAPPEEAVAPVVEPVQPAAEVEAAPAAPEPPKEPKVPRVILEVGADFIGVVHNDGMRGGLVVLTHHPRRAERSKAAIEKAFQDKTLTLGLVTGVIKGGIEVDVDGLRAFAPGSHVDMRMGADLSHLVGQRLPFLVTQYAKRGRDLVLSRKGLIEEEARKSRADALAKLKVGEELEGIVRSVVPFGAFVDVGGIEGLVPLQEMSHNRADGPSDVFKAGEPTRVKVVKIDDRGKVWLSRRATIPDPWQQVAKKYAQGTRHAGKVVRLQPFGAFIELEPGVDGLIHTADLSIKRIETPGDVVKIGESLDVVVSNVDPSNHKIALHPAPSGDMANEAPQRVAPHKAVKVRVVAIESGGLVVRVLGVTGRNARGYITSAGTGTPRGTELRKAFTVGQDVDAKVVEIDPRRSEIKLSIKALSEEQERSAYQQYRQQLKAEARFTLADLLTKKSGR